MAASSNFSRRSILLGAAAIVAAARYSSTGYAQEQPLASWNDGAAKRAIFEFVRAISSQVAPEDRIATFDQDGTLWVEHPVYTQAMFALERLETLAPQHPDWAKREPFKAVLAKEQAAIAKF